jgi:hypothetical protein
MPKNSLLSVSAVIVSLVLFWGQNTFSQESNSGSVTDPTVDFKGGWVIEIGDQEQTGGEFYSPPVQVPVTEPSQPAGGVHQPGSRGIEYIVGGQGSGGVAKKQTLPIVD